jgi:hypothetical protein
MREFRARPAAHLRSAGFLCELIAGVAGLIGDDRDAIIQPQEVNSSGRLRQRRRNFLVYFDFALIGLDIGFKDSRRSIPWTLTVTTPR